MAAKEEMGDLLFAVVNLCRFQKVNAEEALRSTNAKFTKRFQEIEQKVEQEGRDLSDCTLEELDAVWEAAKEKERKQEDER